MHSFKSIFFPVILFPKNIPRDFRKNYQKLFVVVWYKFSVVIIFKIYLFLSHWVFGAACGLSSCAEWGLFSVAACGLLTGGLSGRWVQALVGQASVVGALGLQSVNSVDVAQGSAALRHVGSFWTTDRSCIPANLCSWIGKRIHYLLTTREAVNSLYLKKKKNADKLRACGSCQEGDLF